MISQSEFLLLRTTKNGTSGNLAPCPSLTTRVVATEEIPNCNWASALSFTLYMGLFLRNKMF
nr:MAG TPA: hypothetical protein [Caudoviricetes sp.]